MTLVEYADRETMFADLACLLAGQLGNALAARDTVSLAVPGGTTPGPIFDRLSQADLDWARVRVLLTDERRVPADHARSNERLLRERLLVANAAEAQFVRLVPETDDMSDVERAIARSLPLDVLVLGMGADMHTASLFPGSPHLDTALADNAPPVMMADASEGLEPRITLTGPVLAAARLTHVVIAGNEKREALEKAGSLPAREAPIATVLPKATVHWAP